MIDIEFQDDIGVIFTLHNEFLYNEVKKAIEKLFLNEKFPSIRYWIIDRRNSTNYKLTTKQLIELSELCITASQHKKTLTMILISGTELQYGMSKMFEAHMEPTGWDVKGFKDMRSAKDWIIKHM